MIEDIYEMKNVYIICLRASNGEFFRIRRKIYKDKAEALEVVRKMNERTHCDSYLRNASPLLRGSGRGYLAKNKDTLEYYALSLKCSEEFYQTIFTESEIAEMDITGFQKVEVNE